MGVFSQLGGIEADVDASGRDDHVFCSLRQLKLLEDAWNSRRRNTKPVRAKRGIEPVTRIEMMISPTFANCDRSEWCSGDSDVAGADESSRCRQPLRGKWCPDGV